MLKLKLETIIRKTVNNIGRKRRPAWYKATEDDKEEYTEILSDKISQLIFLTVSSVVTFIVITMATVGRGTSLFWTYCVT